MSKKRTQTHEHSHGAHGKAGHGHEPGHEHGHEHGAAPEHGHEHDDDLIVVPKGESRPRFYFKLGLMIFLLIIFVVPGALMSSLTSDGAERDSVYVSWDSPAGDRHELGYQQFMQAKRDLLLLNTTNPGLPQFRGAGNLALLGLGDFDPEEDLAAARFLVLEELAEAEGIRVSKEELTDSILQLFGSPEMYLAVLEARRRSISAAEFEDVLRRALMVRRFLGYLASNAATADPAEVVRRWQEEHQEFAFDYVQVATADFADAARETLPADEELEAWFTALPAGRKAKYNTPPRWSAQFAVVPLGEDAAESWTVDELLARYPRPEGSDPEELALQYYNNFKFYRFKRPEPLTEEEESDPQLRQFFPFEEVQEAALREAPVYAALQDWHAELVTAANAAADAAAAATDGEPPADAPTFDLAAEAAAVGVQLVATTEARSQQQWMEAEMPWGGTESRIVARMSGVAEGRLVPSVYVDQDAMVIAQVVEKLAPSLPPFAEIRDQVADEWVSEHQAELATAKLEDLRDQLGERPAAPEDETQPTPPFEPSATPEAFAAAATALGLELRRREYAERKQPGFEPDEEPIETLLRFDPLFFSVEEGAVPPAKTDLSREHAFVVRFAGQRDPEISGMEPADLQSLRRQVEGESVSRFFERTFGSEAWLAEHHGLRLTDPRKPREGEAPKPGS